jgi:uncharacterized membrane protein YphA (DoxX/SURF4 family)
MIKVLATNTTVVVIIIRLMVGAVFVSEGIQKLLYPDAVGAGRFEKIGIPSPEIVAPVVACFEVSCGTLVLVGAFTRLAVVPLIVIMLTAIATTKVPILMGLVEQLLQIRRIWLRIGSACSFEGAI